MTGATSGGGCPANARLTRLDGIRGIAATGVMLHHIFLFLAPWQFSAVPLAPIATWIREYGWTLVDLFFVLSGYVMAHVYLRDDTLKTKAGLTKFWVARIARLWPLHLALLVAIGLFAPHDPSNTVVAFIAHLFMLQAFVTPVAQTFDWSAWSLSVEVFCYAIFSIANLHGRRTLLLVTALLLLVSAYGYVAMSHPGGPFSGGVFRRGLFGFFIGQTLWHLRSHLAKAPTAMLLALLPVGFLFVTGPFSSAFFLAMISWPCLLLLVLRTKAMEARWLLWLGDRSYAIYLINLPLVQAADRVTSGQALNATQIVAVQGAIVVAVLILSEIAFRVIEAPMRQSIRAMYERREELALARSRALA